MYLVEGSERALLIDTGDVKDEKQVRLYKTVSTLLHNTSASHSQLLVVHTHRHSDHRAGDSQFAGQPGVVVAPFDLSGVQRFYHFTHWPHGIARLELGDRAIDVLPTPGHNETHVVFYDEQSHNLFGGDFLMPGRLLIDDVAGERESARTMIRFISTHPVSEVLGGHDEMSADGRLYRWGAHDHPNERPLPLTAKQALFILAAVRRFNGVYGTAGPLVIENSLLIVALELSAPLLLLLALGWMVRRLSRWQRHRRFRWTAPSLGDGENSGATVQ